MSCDKDTFNRPLSDAEMNRLAVELGVGPEPRHRQPKGPNRQARRRAKAEARKSVPKPRERKPEPPVIETESHYTCSRYGVRTLHVQQVIKPS